MPRFQTPSPRSVRGHRRSSSAPPVATAGAWALAALVVAIPLARGGVDPWAQAAALAIALGSALLIGGGTPAVCASALALLGVAGVIALQLVPVPARVHSLAPGAVRIFDLTLAPMGLYPTARAMSLDPPATARELANAITVIAAFVAARNVADTRRRRNHVLFGLAASGPLLALVVVGIALAGAGPLVAPHFPFVNRNHLATAMNLSAFVALALALRAHGERRVAWLVAFAISAAVSILTLSRGGFGALFLGGALFVVLRLRASHDPARGSRRASLAPAAGALVAALGAAAYLAVDPLVEKLGTLRSGAADTRWQLLRPAVQVLQDFPWLGVGRGAFPDVFAGYQLESATYQFTHVENEWLQALLDLGIPGGLLLVGTFAWIWFTVARARDLSRSEIGLLSGTAAVALQNVVDFSLDLPGVAIPFAVAMGLLAKRQRRVGVRRPVFVGVGTVLGLVAAGGLLFAWRHDARADAARVAAAPDATAKAEAATGGAARHPADWYPHAIAGVALSGEGRCREAMPWLVRAMALSPSAPAPHLAAARCLAGRNDAAARREYRLAILFGSPALPEAVARYPALDALFDITPATPDGVLALGAVLEPVRPSDAFVAYRRALDEYADDRALVPLGRVAARLGEHEVAVTFARRHEAAFKSDASGYAIAASSLFELGRDTEADAELDRGLAASPGSPTLLRLRAARAMAARRWSEARRIAEQIAPRSADDVAEKDLLVARTFVGQGRVAEAIECVRSAQAARPDRPDILLILADLSEQAGRIDDAIEALRRAAALPGASQRYAARIAALEATRAAQPR